MTTFTATPAAVHRESSASTPPESSAPAADPPVSKCGAVLHSAQVIGQGAFSKVVRIGSFAIKIANDVAYCNLLLHEFRVLKRLRGCENIVCALKVGRANASTFVLVLEYGGLDLIEAFPKSTEEAFVVYRQVSKAIEFMHARHVVHLDIKTENIVIDSLGRVRLIDFGLSRLLNPTEYDSRTLRGVNGSEAYCCPEILSNARYNGFEADSWSLGIFAVALFSRMLPWTKATVDDCRFARFVKDDPASSSTYFVHGGILKGVPQWVLSIIDETLVVNADRRRRRWGLGGSGTGVASAHECKQGVVVVLGGDDGEGEAEETHVAKKERASY